MRRITEVYTEYDDFGRVIRNLRRETVEEDDAIVVEPQSVFPYPLSPIREIIAFECDMPEECESCGAHCASKKPDFHALADGLPDWSKRYFMPDFSHHSGNALDYPN